MVSMFCLSHFSPREGIGKIIDCQPQKSANRVRDQIYGIVICEYDMYNHGFVSFFALWYLWRSLHDHST